MREGRYAFYSGDEFTREVASVEVLPLAPVLEGARRCFPLKVMAAALRANLGEYPVRSPSSAGTCRRWRWTRTTSRLRCRSTAASC